MPDPVEPCPSATEQAPTEEACRGVLKEELLAKAEVPKEPPKPKIEPVTPEEQIDCSYGCRLGVVTDRVKARAGDDERLREAAHPLP